jgi:glycosyltransferase involved in cell wall biosynthesis
MNLFFATSARGFMKHLFLRKDLSVKFAFRDSQLHSSTSRLKSFLSKIVRSRIFDILGVIQIIKPPKGYDLYGSCNRFLDADKPYFIYVENPTALYHYCLGRNKSFLGKRKVNKNLNNPHLSALIFWSDACRNTFETVCGKIPQKVITKTIYGLVPKNGFVSEETIKAKCCRKELKLLYVVQGMRFFSKGGLEVIKAYKTSMYWGVDNNITLTIITNLDIIGASMCKKITDLGITLLDFKFSPEQMEKIYADANILLQPTSDESFGYTILEAMKGGCAIIASRLYAIPEMVQEGSNGFLTDPHWWFFSPDNLPNPKVWNHRKKTIYSGKISDRIVSFLAEKIQLLNNDRNLLEQVSLNSYKKANSAPFDENTIVSQWNEVFCEMARTE